MHDEHAVRPERFYVVGVAGSFYFDTEVNEGFETPEAAAEWARTQTAWAYGSELDFSDGVTSIIALGSDLIANEAAWEEWDGEGEWPDAPAVRNFALDLGLVTDAAK